MIQIDKKTEYQELVDQTVEAIKKTFLNEKKWRFHSTSVDFVLIDLDITVKHAKPTQLIDHGFSMQNKYYRLINSADIMSIYYIEFEKEMRKDHQNHYLARHCQFDYKKLAQDFLTERDVFSFFCRSFTTMWQIFINNQLAFPTYYLFPEYS